MQGKNRVADLNLIVVEVVEEVVVEVEGVPIEIALRRRIQRAIQLTALNDRVDMNRRTIILIRIP
jgi:hypothetical protein